MHNYECPQKRSISTESLEVQLSGKPDPRLNRSLFLCFVGSIKTRRPFTTNYILILTKYNYKHMMRKTV